MNKSDSVLLGGMPVSRSAQRKLGIRSYKPPPGAEKIPCSICNEHTWMGVNVMKLKAAHALAVVCATCLKKDLPDTLTVLTLGKHTGEAILDDGTHYGPTDTN